MSNYKEENFQSFKDDWIAKAEELVLKVFPRKALEIEKLLTGQDFHISKLNEIKEKAEINIPRQNKMFDEDESLDDDSDDDLTSKSKKLSFSCEFSTQLPAKLTELSKPSEENQVKSSEENQVKSSEQNQVKSSQETKEKKVSEHIDRLRDMFPQGEVNSNVVILELMNIIKPLILQMMDDAGQLRMWVSFLKPRIEDVDIIGDEIQKGIISEISKVENGTYEYFTHVSKYFDTRSSLVVKIARYPFVEDFRRSLVELDENIFLKLRNFIRLLRDEYTSLNDIVTKNLEKIKQPRSP